jgi:hypothetical protein
MLLGGNMKGLKLFIVALCTVFILYAQTSGISVGNIRLAPRLLNYQGYLTDTLGVPVSDSLDMTFSIFDAISGGNELWSEAWHDVVVENGIFSLLLGDQESMPDSIFTDFSDTWLELTLEGPQTLTPRTRITAAGYAFAATYSDTAQYARVGAADNDWALSSDLLYPSGSYGLLMRSYNMTYGSHDTTHVNFGIACTTGTVGPSNTYCTVSGGQGNTASWTCATVGGGRKNTGGWQYATVGGGYYNITSGYASTICGGDSNTASNDHAIVSGGFENIASGIASTIGGGYNNQAVGYYSTVSGGVENIANTHYAAICGGYADTVYARYGGVLSGFHNLAGDNVDYDTAALVVGGWENSATAKYATVGGGKYNISTIAGATISGGYNNEASAPQATISGGRYNTAIGYRSTIGGGEFNFTGWSGATVAGGSNNSADSAYSFVGGGYQNHVAGNYSAILGGYTNTIDTSVILATIAGGNQNFISASAGAIIGGAYNRVDEQYGVIGGGYGNVVEGLCSAILCGDCDTIFSGADYSILFGLNSKLTQDSTIMIDMPHIRFGDEVTGYEFPQQRGTNEQVLVTDGSGNITWSNTPSAGTWSVTDSVLYTNDYWGIARGGAGNIFFGDSMHTHINFGVRCTTGLSGEIRSYSTVTGGRSNAARGNCAVVSGGTYNKADSSYAFVGGGRYNAASNTNATVAGGYADTASGYYSFIGGGSKNYAGNSYVTVCGGEENRAEFLYATVGGGHLNEAGNNAATVGGGYFNIASGLFSTVCGGDSNLASNRCAAVGGGWENIASGQYSVVPGGSHNTASGDRSFAAGTGANAQHDGCFIWADNNTGSVSSTGTNQFIVRATGGIDFTGNVAIRSASTGDTVVELGEGLDYAEGFDISDKDGITPGCVLSIDPVNPGKLNLCTESYDTKVAGIAAGANGLGSGVQLGGGRFDCNVALAGRVYCNVDATESSIEPGDLLTTSARPGYAMKVSNYEHAQGAIIGKAMQRMAKGKTGQILVLVTLQ